MTSSRLARFINHDPIDFEKAQYELLIGNSLLSVYDIEITTTTTSNNFEMTYVLVKDVINAIIPDPDPRPDKKKVGKSPSKNPLTAWKIAQKNYGRVLASIESRFGHVLGFSVVPELDQEQVNFPLLTNPLAQVVPGSNSVPPLHLFPQAV
jgi:hypothetical protein